MSVDLVPAVAYPARPTLPSGQAPAGRRHIYLVFTHTGTRFSKVLKMVTRGEYTHVSIAMDASLDRLYSFGRNSIKERPWEAGFVCEQKDGGVYRELPGTRCTVYQLEVSEEQYRRAQGIIEDVYKRQPQPVRTMPSARMRTRVKRRVCMAIFCRCCSWYSSYSRPFTALPPLLRPGPASTGCGKSGPAPPKTGPSTGWRRRRAGRFR